jgi:hypothetical protein
MEAGIDFVAVDMPVINRFTIHIVAAVAQYERTILAERCQLGIRRAIRNGAKWGFAVRSKEVFEAILAKSLATRRASAARNARVAYPEILRARSDGASTFREVANHLNGRAIPTHSRVGKWHLSTVRDVECRISALQVHDSEPGPVLHRFPVFPIGIASGVFMRRVSFKFAKNLDATLSMLRAEGFNSRIDIVNELNRRNIPTFTGLTWQKSRFENALARVKKLRPFEIIMPLGPVG